MGTYTSNYNLYMPTVGETGWGTLVNGNFTTIDTTMKSLSNRITTVENEVNGNLSCTNVTTSGTITSTGLITANGGVKGNVTGNVQGFLFVKGNIQTSGDVVYAKCDAQTFTGTAGMGVNSTGTFTVNGYSVTFGNPQKHSLGVYTRRSDLTGTAPSNPTTMAVTIKNNDSDTWATVYYKLNTSSTYSKTSQFVGGSSVTLNLTVGKTYNWYVELKYAGMTSSDGRKITISIPALTTYYVKYATP